MHFSAGKPWKWIPSFWQQFCIWPDIWNRGNRLLNFSISSVWNQYGGNGRKHERTIQHLPPPFAEWGVRWPHIEAQITASRILEKCLFFTDTEAQKLVIDTWQKFLQQLYQKIAPFCFKFAELNKNTLTATREITDCLRGLLQNTAELMNGAGRTKTKQLTGTKGWKNQKIYKELIGFTLGDAWNGFWNKNK